MTSIESYFDQQVNWDEAHFFNKITRYKPNQAIAKSFDWINWQNKRVLDIGCGQGYYSIPLAEKAKSVVGIDISGQAIHYAQKVAAKTHLSNVSFQQVDLFEFAPSETFDVVLSITVLMHLQNLSKALNQIYTLLDTNGQFLLSEPNKHYRGLRLTSWRKTQSSIFTQKFSLAQMRKLLIEHKFNIQRESGRIFSLSPTRRTEALIFLGLEKWGETNLLKQRGEHISILAQKV
ncbi:MAG: methyltransferase domain-containing protein [Aliifodinibius sp.]|nr:class I SAM-dependent methyltransferase [Fodinibius sp.]NIV13889.1 methyltransferase domain-containing protein [Fodinibius sp.]NIY27641.1 methyltransferase domain-containing protein [Fodinibius sp.]